MVTQEQILEYVANTPANTNIAVLKNLLGNYESNIYNDPNILEGLWMAEIDEEGQDEEGWYFLLIDEEGEAFRILIKDNWSVVKPNWQFNPNGQVESDREIMDNWRLLNGILYITDDEDEERMHFEKYDMAMLLYGWASSYQPPK